MAVLEPFSTLTPDEVNVLPAEMQFNVPQITCDMLQHRPTGAIDDPAKTATACDGPGTTKYLLDVAKVLGTNIDSASASLGGASSAAAQWQVDLGFAGSSADKWKALTSEAYNNTGGKCIATQPNEDTTKPAVSDGTRRRRQDDRLGAADPGRADTALADHRPVHRQLPRRWPNQLKYGALPVTFTPARPRRSPRPWASDQLQAGLLAAAIGMLLVVVYAFFYYRLLGTVIFLQPDPVGAAHLRRAGAAGPHHRLHADPGRYRRSSSSRWVSPPTRSSSTSNASRTRSTRVEVHEVRCHGPGPGPGARSSRPTRSRSWPPWSSTSVASAR